MIVQISKESNIEINKEMIRVTIYISGEDYLSYTTEKVRIYTPDGNRIVLNPEKADFNVRFIEALDVIVSDKEIEIHC